MMATHEVVKGVRFEEAYTGDRVTVLYLAAAESEDDLIRIEGPRGVCPETASQIADAINELVDGCHEDGDYAHELLKARSKVRAAASPSVSDPGGGK